MMMWMMWMLLANYVFSVGHVELAIGVMSSEDDSAVELLE
jgi:hypothetical protein